MLVRNLLARLATNITLKQIYDVARKRWLAPPKQSTLASRIQKEEALWVKFFVWLFVISFYISGGFSYYRSFLIGETKKKSKEMSENRQQGRGEADGRKQSSNLKSTIVIVIKYSGCKFTTNSISYRVLYASCWRVDVCMGENGEPTAISFSTFPTWSTSASTRLLPTCMYTPSTYIHTKHTFLSFFPINILCVHFF